MVLTTKILLFAAALLYSAASASYFAHFANKSRFSPLPGQLLLGAGLLSQAGAVATMTAFHGQFPVLTMWEAIAVCSLTLAGAYLYLERATRITRMGGFIIAMSALLAWIAAATWQGKQIANPQLEGFLFAFHVLASLFSYSLFFLGFVISVLFLFQHTQIKSGRLGYFFERMPSLQRLDEMTYKSVLAGFVLLTVGMLTGGLWARQVWGDFWSWDPKQSLALAVWLVYAAFIHARYLAGWQGKRSAILSIAGALTMLFSFFGTHFFFRSVHNFF